MSYKSSGGVRTAIAAAISLSLTIPTWAQQANGDCVTRVIYDYCSTVTVLAVTTAAKNGESDKASIIAKSWTDISKPLSSKPELSIEFADTVAKSAVEEFSTETLNACVPLDVAAYANDLQSLIVKATKLCEPAR